MMRFLFSYITLKGLLGSFLLFLISVPYSAFSVGTLILWGKPIKGELIALDKENYTCSRVLDTHTQINSAFQKNYLSHSARLITRYTAITGLDMHDNTIDNFYPAINYFFESSAFLYPWVVLHGSIQIQWAYPTHGEMWHPLFIANRSRARIFDIARSAYIQHNIGQLQGVMLIGNVNVFPLYTIVGIFKPPVGLQALEGIKLLRVPYQLSRLESKLGALFGYNLLLDKIKLEQSLFMGFENNLLSLSALMDPFVPESARLAGGHSQLPLYQAYIAYNASAQIGDKTDNFRVGYGFEVSEHEKMGISFKSIDAPPVALWFKPTWTYFYFSRNRGPIKIKGQWMIEEGLINLMSSVTHHGKPTPIFMFSEFAYQTQFAGYPTTFILHYNQAWNTHFICDMRASFAFSMRMWLTQAIEMGIGISKSELFNYPFQILDPTPQHRALLQFKFNM
jgi:hypothetical protein